MIRKICLFFILVAFICGLSGVCYGSDHYSVEYVEDPDIFVYSPLHIEEGLKYPVLYLIHGRWQQPSIWEEMGLLDILNELYETGQIIPFFIVLPHDPTYLEDMYESDFYNVFLTEVMPFVESNYPVDTDPVNTALGGISRGAQWAQYLGFGEYGRFSQLGIHSPANPFFSLSKIYGIIRDNPDVPMLRIRIDIGNNDNAMRIGYEFSQQLTELFYPHEFILGNGGHDVDYWGKYLPDYLRWYSEGFRINYPV